MKENFLLLVVFWCICIGSKTDGTDLEMTVEEMRRVKGVYCGTHLANTLSTLCRGSYNNRFEVKKSYNEFDYDDDYGEKEEPYQYPFISRSLSNSVFSNRLRKRGIIEECCHKPCSVLELLSYCR